MCPNGPAIWGGCVTRRKHRAESWYFSQKAVTVQGGYGALFAIFAVRLRRTEPTTSCEVRSFSEGGPGTNFSEHYACRGTRMIEAANLSPVTKLEAGVGAVSRYKLSRSKKFIKVQDINWGQMRALPTEAERRWVSGCSNHYKFVLGAGVKAKTMTTVSPEASA